MLAEALRARGLDVVMTRDARRVPDACASGCGGRTRREPDCFVSLHTNASGDRSRRGVETWVLARDAADVEARRAATREHDDVQAMLAELRLLEAHDARRSWRTRCSSSWWRRAAASDRGVRQYGYDVLAGVTAPAVLVEMGFLDHPIEGAALFEPAEQRQHRGGAGGGRSRASPTTCMAAKAGNVRGP